MKPYLNLGCGRRFHREWINIDIVPSDPSVIRHDLSRGIPLSDASCEVVYHAAVLEHIRHADALAFMQECNRVLKPSGIIRVGVPDLERLCRLYLQKLQSALDADAAASHDYDWIMLEIYDQAVREQSGGDMLAYLRQHLLPNEEFIHARIGEEGRQFVQTLQQQSTDKQPVPTVTLKSLQRRLYRRFRALLFTLKQGLLRRFLGPSGMRALEIGRFRLAGEVHHWMYDRYSLARLLRMAGFSHPTVQSATSSQIPDWDTFHLDTLIDGTLIKPDLFFMEAIKLENQVDDR